MAATPRKNSPAAATATDNNNTGCQQRRGRGPGLYLVSEGGRERILSLVKLVKGARSSTCCSASTKHTLLRRTAEKRLLLQPQDEVAYTRLRRRNRKKLIKIPKIEKNTEKNFEIVKRIRPLDERSPFQCPIVSVCNVVSWPTNISS